MMAGKITPTAADLRAVVLEELEAKYRGSVSRGEVVIVRRVLHTELHDRMHACGQLSDDQHGAAVWLHALWTCAGLNPRVCARIDVLRDPVDDEDAPQFQAEEGDRIDQWRALMRSIGGHRAAIVEGMMLGRHPGLRWLCTLQTTLEMLHQAGNSSRARSHTRARE
jgi:hypothetical protein